MRSPLRGLRRLIARLVPRQYSGRRDRLSDEADQAASAYQFRSGL